MVVLVTVDPVQIVLVLTTVDVGATLAPTVPPDTCVTNYVACRALSSSRLTSDSTKMSTSPLATKDTRCCSRHLFFILSGFGPRSVRPRGLTVTTTRLPVCRDTMFLSPALLRVCQLNLVSSRPYAVTIFRCRHIHHGLDQKAG